MPLELQLQQRLSQNVVLTPQLQQAIKLLQLPYLEIAQVIEEEICQNPLLEEVTEDSSDVGKEESSDLQAEDLHLEQQLLESLEPLLQEGSHDHDSMQDEFEAAYGDKGRQHNEWQDLLNEQADLDATPLPDRQQLHEQIEYHEDGYSTPLWNHGCESSVEFSPSSPEETGNLQDMLQEQAQLAFEDTQQRQIAYWLIESINSDGYLATDAIASASLFFQQPQQSIEAILSILQQFEPTGVGCRDLQECLLLQAEKQYPHNNLLRQIILEYLPQWLKKQYPLIAKQLKIDIATIQQHCMLIQNFSPYPGRRFGFSPSCYVIPDVYIKKIGDTFVVMMNDEGLPKLRIHRLYEKFGNNAADKQYIQEKIRSALWFIHSIHMRQRTIYKVVQSILKFQGEFFEKGVTFLKPLVLREVAQDIQMHESTISRATQQKYVDTPQGLFELKYFFSSKVTSHLQGEEISSVCVKQYIKQMISQESPEKPLSDQQLVDLLQTQKNIHIARRTVSKYREILNILPSHQRKLHGPKQGGNH